ncbi:MAG: response regulator [Oscillatoria sp. SIO1A7]|nr:response regulator [Oscillatoria sp. SIO1A7]
MKTILIVEDEPVNVLIFSKIVTKHGGMAVKHSEDVEEIIALAQSGQADLILMDISLRNSHYRGKPVNGIEITRTIKANPETAKLPVILVTANGGKSDREFFLEQSGADDYIPKPITDHKAFITQIRAMLPPD